MCHCTQKPETEIQVDRRYACCTFGLTGIGLNWRRTPWNLILRTKQNLSWAVAAKEESPGSQYFCEDPRGINPPFGKTHTHNVEEVWQCSNVWFVWQHCQSFCSWLVHNLLEGQLDYVPKLGIAFHHSEYEVENSRSLLSILVFIHNTRTMTQKLSHRSTMWLEI